MNEQELKKFVFSETVTVISAMIPKGLDNAFGYFDRIYDMLLEKAKEKGLQDQP